MADPVSLGLSGVLGAANLGLGLFGIGATAAGAAVQAQGVQQQAQAQSSMYTYQSAVAQMNQQIANQNADYAVATGQVKSQQSGMATRAQIGQTKAIQGASGLDVGSGSAAAVRQSESELGQYDQSLIRANAAKEAYNYKVQGWQFGTQSTLDTMAASNARAAGKIGVESSLLGGAASVSSKWLQASQSFGNPFSSSSGGFYGGSPSSNSLLTPIG